MRKRKIKRYDEGGKADIEERSTKSQRLIDEEKAKASDDYAGLGGRTKPTPAPSTWAGPREYITESKEESVEPESSPTKGARNLALEETKKETVKAVAKKKPMAKKASSYEDTGAKIGSQSFSFESKSEPATRARSAAEIRAGKPAAAESTGSKIPKNTFLTPERLESSRKSYYSGFDSKPVRSAADIRAGRGMKSGGKVSSASSRADGIATRGKTRGKVY